MKINYQPTSLKRDLEKRQVRIYVKITFLYSLQILEINNKN